LCEQTICATIDDETKANDGQEEQKNSIYNACEYSCGMQFIQVGSCISISSLSKLFAIVKFIMHLVLHEFVCAMNVLLKIQFKRHVGDDLVEVMTRFKNLWSLPSIHGTIDVT